MADVLQSGMSFLASQMKSYAGQTVTYTPLGSTAITLTATVGSSILKLSDEYGNVQIYRTERDYLIAQADLVQGVTVVIPQKGDRITHIEGSKTNIYEVQAPTGEPVWRWSDSYRYRRRIHTKLVSSI